MAEDKYLELYKLTVDYCKTNNIKDYELKLPLISYANRDRFIVFLKNNLSSKKIDIINDHSSFNDSIKPIINE
jgi:hypothetical protein